VFRDGSLLTQSPAQPGLSEVPDSGTAAPASPEALDRAVNDARAALLALQHPDGYWCFELEADCTIPAEYILMMHFMDEIDEELTAKLAVYLRSHQESHDGWSLYPGGGFDMSCSVKAYYALKLAGDDPNAAHMVRARQAILTHGGAARSNVFTRFTLAMFEQVPWRAVPLVPVEIMLLPRWFPFHLRKVSYWSRTVMVPLAILYSLRARAKNPLRVNVVELFTTPPTEEKSYFPIRSRLNAVLLHIERLAKLLEPAIPNAIRRHAIMRAEQWIIARLNGTDGLGAIFPAMVNAYEVLALLGYPADHPYRITAKRALEKLLVIGERSAYCQPCVSPVWDTALACLALQEAGGAQAAIRRALDWAARRQLVDVHGDWREYRQNVKGGGWPFQFANDYYPDIDDTCVVGWIMYEVDRQRYRQAIERAAEWVCAMQSKNGGFAAFDADNAYYYLNEIPFADHGALLDPPTSDVTGRCLAFLGPLGSRYGPVLRGALSFLRREQERHGGWYGRWGTNYIYGTWSVLTGLERAAERPDRAYIQRAVAWLKRMQRSDGGWAEGNDTYFHPERAGQGEPSTAFQTAWAILALMASGGANCDAVRRGAEYLLRGQRPDGTWEDRAFTAPGFPRAFYLKYHGYDKYFPLWALARYRNLAGETQ
jgi:squalene-hopene/tetraprenyl-beta-curcumene cyclase